MTMMFSLLDRQRDTANNRERERKKRMQKRGQYKKRERNREGRVDRELTYVNVCPACVLAAAERRINLGDSRKWRELVN